MAANENKKNRKTECNFLYCELWRKYFYFSRYSIAWQNCDFGVIYSIRIEVNENIFNKYDDNANNSMEFFSQNIKFLQNY